MIVLIIDVCDCLKKGYMYQLNILCCKISNLNEIMQARFLYNIMASDAALAWTFVERAESGGKTKPLL